MSIVKSEKIDDAVQVDGRRWINERHTDDLGVVYTFGPYLADADFDVEAALPDHAAAVQTAIDMQAIFAAQAQADANAYIVTSLQDFDVETRLSVLTQLDSAELSAAATQVLLVANQQQLNG